MQVINKLAARVALAASVVVGTAFATAPAHAVTVNGADTITITDDVGFWLQIAEVIAIQSGTGIDVALASNGATAVAIGGCNQGGGACAAYAIDGIYPASYPFNYHSLDQTGDSLQITLGTPANLASLTIYGRGDCCQERDVYNVTIANSASQILYSGTGLDASSNGFVTVTFDVAATPLPAALPLFATGLGAMGLFGWRRKRKAQAVV